METLLTLVLQENAEAATYAYGRFKYGWTPRSTIILGVQFQINFFFIVGFTIFVWCSDVNEDPTVTSIRYSGHYPSIDNIPFVILHLKSYSSLLSHYKFSLSSRFFHILIASFYLSPTSLIWTLDPRDPSVTKSMVSTYKHLSMLVTNIALNQVESNLKLADDQKGLEYLSHSVALMSEDFQPTDLRYALYVHDTEFLIFFLYAVY
jgi:hypothetical protein